MWDPNTKTPIGKTYAEIDADQAEFVRELNVALVGARDKAARWWQYQVSHSTFELVVGEPLGEDNIVICLTACSRISGPVEWPTQQLQLVWQNPPEKRNWHYRLSDNSVDFRVEAGALDWQRNYDIYRLGSLACPSSHNT